MIHVFLVILIAFHVLRLMFAHLVKLKIHLLELQGADVMMGTLGITLLALQHLVLNAILSARLVTKLIFA
jgi:hypothetical protein